MVHCFERSTEGTCKAIKARAAGNHDVLDHVIECHDAEVAEHGTNGDYTEDTDGDPSKVRMDSTEVTSKALKTREANNHVVIDRAIGSRDVEKIELGTEEDERTDEDGYPWFAARVICHWLTTTMERDNTL